MSDIAMPPKTTIVEVSGKLESGETVSQNVPVNHADGVGEPQIILAAFGTFKNLGGIVTDSPDGGMDFYSPIKIVGPIHFAIKHVSLAGPETLAGLKRRSLVS